MLPNRPLLLAPRLDAKIWGGRALARFGFDLPPDEPIGEAVITASEATVLDGEHAGRSLGELIAMDPTAAIGERGLKVTRGQPLFPLLIKLIDANDVLSIQVHPDDAHAPAGSLGKTEAWYVLDAGPDAAIYLGMNEGTSLEDVARLARAGTSTAHLMRRVPATPGATFFIPAGTVHALGAGVVIYEIQQPSAITYRLDDWGRVGPDGRPREMHVEEGLAVLDPSSRPEPIEPRTLPSDTGTRKQLVSCPLFTAELITLDSGETTICSGEGAPQVFTCTRGTLHVSSGGCRVPVSAGQTVALLACAGPAELTASSQCTLLRGWLDPEADRTGH